MKKIIILILVSILIVSGAYLICSNRLSIGDIHSGKVVFLYSSENIESELIKEDMESLMAILENKKLYYDSPSCGFSENISIKLYDEENEYIFCVAMDSCPVIFYKNAGRYIKLSDEENIIVREILEEYGFYFPCI